MIIGVCGFAGSGKDTVADYLKGTFGFYKTSFARVLKEAARLIFDFSHEQVYGPSQEREKEDTRYPFSGCCPRCHKECKSLRGLIYEGAPNPRSEGKMWWCADCDEFYPQYVTPRLALQTLGTEWGRSLYPNIWTDATLRNIQEYRERFPHIKNYVISDVRFQNEVEAITREPDGFVIRLLRGEQVYTHASEAELATIDLDEFDQVISNFGSLTQLYDEVDRTFHKFSRLVENV